MIDVPAVKERLRQARREAKMTGSEVAEKLGVSFQAVYKWENVGYTYPKTLPTVDHVVELCELYGISADWLFFGVGQPYFSAAEKRLISAKMYNDNRRPSLKIEEEE